MLSQAHRQQLLHIASHAILQGLELPSEPLRSRHLSAPLEAPGASFVSLHLNGQLRGCIGTLEAHQSLAQDVADNACQAAFHDPRFAPLRQPELTELTLDIAILGKPQALPWTTEAELLEQLEVGRDGVILEFHGQRGTFLPSVWESLPEPRRFLRHLKRKAGLNEDFWSREIHVSRYRTETFGAAFLKAAGASQGCNTQYSKPMSKSNSNT